MSRAVGVLGGGQLGRMLALAGVPLGLRFIFLDPSDAAPAAAVGRQIRASYDDHAALDELAAAAEVVTYEFENVPASSVRHIAPRVEVNPPVEALEIAQDRLAEKQMLEKAGVPVVPFEPASSQLEIEDAVARLGLPAVVKTRRLGYDGRGQVLIRNRKNVTGVFARLGGRPLIVESFVRFTREASLIAVRDRDGSTACYPLVENHHRDGILRLSLAPAPGLDGTLQLRAEDHARSLMESLGYVGVLAVEFFQTGDDLVANEFAPRVHNSGHWTIEGADCSQFENHLRAILGLPLGPTTARGHCAMVNLIGEVPQLEALAAVAGARLHVYGKGLRPKRKVGHVTVCAPDAVGRDGLLETVRRVVV
jgi:5-(carboxyamino)imidazole ribonucleotide synthase